MLVCVDSQIEADSLSVGSRKATTCVKERLAKFAQFTAFETPLKSFLSFSIAMIWPNFALKFKKSSNSQLD